MNRAIAIIRRSDPEPVEWLLGLLMMTFGFWVLMPWDTWVDLCGGSGVQAYHVISSVWQHEWIQGSAFLFVGLMHVASALRQWGLRERRTLAFAAACLWCVNWISFCLWRWQSAALPVYGMHMLSHMWLFWRHTIELRTHGSR